MSKKPVKKLKYVYKEEHAVRWHAVEISTDGLVKFEEVGQNTAFFTRCNGHDSIEAAKEDFLNDCRDEAKYDEDYNHGINYYEREFYLIPRITVTIRRKEVKDET